MRINDVDLCFKCFFRYYGVIYESFISKRMAMFVSALAVVLTISHAAVFSMINDNISSLQRTCIDPNAKYDFPKDSLYGISLMSMLIYNLISFGLCIHLYVYLLNEEKKSTCRNRQIIGVSGLFQYYSETPKMK